MYRLFQIDKESYWKLRDPISKKSIGYKSKSLEDIYVPTNGLIQQFIDEYQALTNYNMGQAVEIFDQVSLKVNRFSVIYSFKKRELPKGFFKNYNCYSVLEVPLSNLDILELINDRKKKGLQDE